LYLKKASSKNLGMLLKIAKIEKVARKFCINVH
jgi:hypothetical protein